MLTLVLLVVLFALVFEFINGFHDTANSIATVVATKVLSPSQAVILAAAMNLIGAFWGTAVAKTIASGLVDTDVVDVTSQVLICALLGGIVWNLITWWRGLPSSSSHALIGGLCGAALAAAHNNWHALIWSQAGERAGRKNAGLLWKVVVPMVTSPLLGFLLGLLIMGLLFAIISGMASQRRRRCARMARPRWVNALLRQGADRSAGLHGLRARHQRRAEDHGHHRAGVFGAQADGTLDNLPSWLAFLHPRMAARIRHRHAGSSLTCALVMAAGTAAGGWRIIKTLGHKMVKLHPIHGFAAETASATILVAAAHFGMPVSTTHNISDRDHGRGLRQEPDAIKWTVIERMVWAWILTIPAAGGIAYGLFRLFEAMGWT